MSEYDQRQYRLMLGRLKAFEAGQITIDSLIADLRGLVQALLQAEPSWKQTFLEYWADLEVARALALSRESNELTDTEITAVRDATAKMRLLALEKIDDPADHASSPPAPRK
jgi:hypothetical protein